MDAYYSFSIAEKRKTMHIVGVDPSVGRTAAHGIYGVFHDLFIVYKFLEIDPGLTRVFGG